MRDKLRLVAAVLAACGSAGSDAPPTLEVGSSAQGFEPLAPGGAILLHHGPQGGYHVYLNVRATGVAPGAIDETPRRCDDPSAHRNPCIDFEVTDLEAQKTLDAFVGLRMPLTASTAQAGSFDLVPPRLVTMATTSFAELEGHHLLVKATLDDVNGVHAEQTLEVICTAAP